jgi:hypothetical protein
MIFVWSGAVMVGPPGLSSFGFNEASALVVASNGSTVSVV